MYNDAAAIANQFFAAHNSHTAKVVDDFINTVSSSSPVRLNIIHFAAAFLNTNCAAEIKVWTIKLGVEVVIRSREECICCRNRKPQLKLVLANTQHFCGNKQQRQQRWWRRQQQKEERKTINRNDLKRTKFLLNTKVNNFNNSKITCTRIHNHIHTRTRATPKTHSTDTMYEIM